MNRNELNFRNEDAEKSMEQDMLEKLLVEMSDEYPELSRISQFNIDSIIY